ncbi:MAG: pectate lyase [Bacillota bacterium]
MRVGKWYKIASIVLSLALVLPLVFVSPASAVTFLQDGFDDGRADNWSPTTGSWSVLNENGNYVYYQSSSSEGRNSAGSQSWTDYSVTADMKIVNFNGSTRTYVTGRYKDGNNYYAASLYNSNGGTLEIRKKVSGSSTTLASKSNYGLTTSNWYNVKLEMSGTSINMYVNGKLELSAVDSSLTAGAAGLVTFKSIAKFDNVIVSDASSEPSPTETPTPTVTDQVYGNNYNLTGFADGNTGGGAISETDSRYMKVYDAADLAVALRIGSGYKVIEIMNDLDLGWNELPVSAKVSPFSAHNSALTHPVLIETGISKVTIDSFNGLTIFSANGAKIKHAAFTFKRSSNVILRNLEFDELWEWDEATKGNYDKNDWDYITVETSSKIWIDHCTFNKAYDGLVDVKKGSNSVTISWSRFVGDDRSANSWVTQQIDAMESNLSAYPMYAFLRSGAVGLSKNDIIAIASSQKKGHLIGATEFAMDNADLEVTLHHNYYQDVQDRMPRLRAGNVHAYNIVMDNAGAREAKRRITSAMEKAISSKWYHFGITSNGAISTENGAVLLEKSVIIDVVYPLRNNQADVDNAAYTGKILALDTIYSLDGTTYRGNSDSPDSPLSPVPADIKTFAWNGFTSLPYNYMADDPSSLKDRLTATDGAGAGKLAWSKEKWLDTIYTS